MKFFLEMDGKGWERGRRASSSGKFLVHTLLASGVNGSVASVDSVTSMRLASFRCMRGDRSRPLQPDLSASNVNVQLIIRHGQVFGLVQSQLIVAITLLPIDIMDAPISSDQRKKQKISKGDG
jgi:hypothetical protein